MRSALFIFFLFILALAGFGAAPLKAEKALSFCEDAKTMTDVLACVKDRHEQAAARLQKSYDALSMQLGTQNTEPLKTAQKNWIAYRDQECTRQTEQVEIQSLKRIQNLDCLSILTNQRSLVLESSVDGMEPGAAAMPEKTLPRWVNVLSADYPDVFWRYGERLQADLDCDGQEEEILTGLQVVKPHTQNDEKAPAYVLETAIAISKKPVTGRPKVGVLHFPVSSAPDGPPHVCAPQMKLLPSARPVLDADNTEICPAAIRVTSEACPAFFVYWDGKDYKAEAEKQVMASP